MSDDEVRELERRWRASGSDADEAAWLVARLRAGTLEPAQVELLARLGDRAAVLATGVPAAPRPTTVNGLETWLREALVPGGLQALVRGALVVLRDFCRELDRDAYDGGRRRIVSTLRPAIEASEEWCGCPCPSHADEANRVAARSDAATADSGRIGVLVHTGVAVARAITEHEAATASDTDRAQAIDGLVDVCMLQVQYGRPPLDVTTARIQTDLRGWIVGPVDPVAERVRARRG